MSWLMFHLLILDSLYNKELIQYLISLDGEFVLDYCSMSGTESDFHLLRLFLKVNLSKIRIDVYWMNFDQIFFVNVFCQSNWN